MLFFQLITVLCIYMYGLCPCACVAYDLIKVMLLLFKTHPLICRRRRCYGDGTDSTHSGIFTNLIRTWQQQRKSRTIALYSLMMCLCLRTFIVNVLYALQVLLVSSTYMKYHCTDLFNDS